MGMKSRRGWGSPGGSELNPLGDAEGIIDFDAEIANGAFELRMSEKESYGSEVARLFVNLSRLCTAHRVCAVRGTNETSAPSPSMDDAHVLSCREVRLLPEAAREQVLTPSATDAGQPISNSASGLASDFEPNRSAGLLLLDHRRSIPNPSGRAYVLDFEPNEVTAPGLAVNGKIEHSPPLHQDLGCSTGP